MAGMDRARHLTGEALDTAVDGLASGQPMTRSDVVLEVRKVMFSGARAGLHWSDIQPYLTDVARYRLAAQFATGRGERPIPTRTRNEFLLKQWADVQKVVAERPAWTPGDIREFIELVREELEHADLSVNQAAVMQVVITLATQIGTSRPAVPARVVAGETGISKATAHRTLMRLTEDGYWLGLAKRGNKHRANLYNLAPALARTYRGASPPASQGPPTSHPPTSHPEAEKEPSDMTALIALTGQDAEGLHRFLGLPAEKREHLLRLMEDSETDKPASRHLRSVAGGGDQ